MNTDAIAAEAVSSKQTLYVYYKSKEDLLEDVLREFIHGVTSSKPEAPAALSDRAGLRVHLVTLARTLLDSIMQPDYLAMVRVVFAEISRFPQIGRLFTSAVPRRVLDAVAALLQQAHAQGLLRVETPDPRRAPVRGAAAHLRHPRRPPGREPTPACPGTGRADCGFVSARVRVG